MIKVYRDIYKLDNHYYYFQNHISNAYSIDEAVDI